VFFTKKEAIQAKQELDLEDTPSEIKKRHLGFERKVVRLTINY
jgi:hypothetical protein